MPTTATDPARNPDDTASSLVTPITARPERQCYNNPPTENHRPAGGWGVRSYRRSPRRRRALRCNGGDARVVPPGNVTAAQADTGIRTAPRPGAATHMWGCPGRMPAGSIARDSASVTRA
ncbi:hypothetical protein EHYA_00669 [Embleya hyalina]|uniref:Uncharacterized protein n=1 Tax=Embleya hyalina TaxID=516124 RepID=A0A401YEH7_9ACTN|nr:hypothetical protein EHYA_00669 [Embleya hyalina]